MQNALGHAHIETTARYLHARPAYELAAAFGRAQSGTAFEASTAGSPAAREGATRPHIP